ncbi:F-box/FBD/LRR-repeat protein At1g13570-like [Rutidosis leptorrhynchoides]|uniref:F-box/FBD/LRR-repeat protein At1g13570-like n=1 Tax=Rutidosis leptorrhynchoides TaxID=125765 RepID=UPI003A9A1EC4
MMEQYNASELASEDIISRLPENVITHILDFLPIQYAVRTSILSRNWRFKWTLLRHVVFDEKFFEFLQVLGGENWYDESIINRLLLHLKGCITKFHLYIPNDKVLDVMDVNHWVMILSRKGIKELYLTNMRATPIMLSTHLFSCVELERLVLRNCYLYPAPTFCGFPNLLSLELYRVAFENGNFGELIAQCPLLEFLKVYYCDPIGKVKLDEIAKLKNLKCLSFPLCKLDNIAITCSSVFHLLGHLSKLHELYLDLRMCKFLGESGAEKSVRTSSFRSLTTLKLNPIDFCSEIKLLFAFEMIWASPELQTIEITAKYNDAVPPPPLSSSALNHISMGKLKLRNVVFESFRGSENEICLIKNLLACSPLLEKINIYAHPSLMFGGDNGKLMFAIKLLKLHRASSTAEVNICWCPC